MSEPNKEMEGSQEGAGDGDTQTQQTQEPQKNTELEFYKTETENLKQQLADLKKQNEEFLKNHESKNKKDTESESRLLTEEIERLKAENQKILQEQTNKQKLNSLQQQARKLGLKENYLGMLEKFVDLSSVSNSNEYSYEVAVQKLKRELPDLFGEKSFNVPLPTDTSTNIEEYSMNSVKEKVKSLIKDGKLQEAQNLVDKYNINKL